MLQKSGVPFVGCLFRNQNGQNSFRVPLSNCTKNSTDHTEVFLGAVPIVKQKPSHVIFLPVILIVKGKERHIVIYAHY